jgi:hypothetical protein
MKNLSESQTSKNEVTKNENSEKDFFVIRKKRLYSFLIAVMCTVITFFNIRDYLLPLLKEPPVTDWTTIYAPFIIYIFLISAVILGVASFKEIKEYSKKGLIYFSIHSLWVGPLMAFVFGLISLIVTGFSNYPFVAFVFICVFAGLFVIGFFVFLIYGSIVEFKK